MRILYLADIRFPLERANGIQTIETCHALAARGHEVSLVVRPDSHQPARDPLAFYGLTRLDSLHVEVAPVTGPPAARRAGYLTFAVGRALGRTRQDIVFTRDLGLASLLLRLPAGLRAPLVFEAHTIAADEAAERPRMLTGAQAASPAKVRRLATRDRTVWQRADGYVTITRGLERELEHRFGPRHHVAVVPDGVRITAHGPRPTDHAPRTTNHAPRTTDHAPRITDHGPRTTDHDPRPTDTFTIGYAGHLYPWKGVDAIVEVVTALQDTRAVIIGGHDQEPDLARVKAFAVQLDCASRIAFTGMLPPADVAARLREADVLVLPNPASAVSNRFTSPLKLFEYMAAGRPIVASDLPSIREVLTDERNALLVPPGNPPALTAAVRRLKDDRELGARLAAQAAEDVLAYTWDRRAERLETFFREVRG